MILLSTTTRHRHRTTTPIIIDDSNKNNNENFQVVIFVHDDNNTLIMERPSITVPGKIVKWVDIFHKQNEDYPSEIQEYSKVQAAAERLHYENEDILDFDMLICKY